MKNIFIFLILFINSMNIYAIEFHDCQYGSSGRVIDKNNIPIENAIVTANTSVNKWIDKTGKEGWFHAGGLWSCGADSKFKLTVEKEGYSTEIKYFDTHQLIKLNQYIEIELESIEEHK